MGVDNNGNAIERDSKKVQMATGERDKYGKGKNDTHSLYECVFAAVYVHQERGTHDLISGPQNYVNIHIHSSHRRSRQ